MATNLQFIKSVELFTTASNLEVTNCFPSEYDVFQIVFSNISTSTAFTDIYDIRFLDTSNAIISSTSYDYAVNQLRSSSTFEEKREQSTTTLKYLTRAYNDPRAAGATMYVYNPADTSSYTFAQWQSAGQVNLNLNGITKGIGVLRDTQQVTGIRLFGNGGGSMNSAKISVYGLK